MSYRRWIGAFALLRCALASQLPTARRGMTKLYPDFSGQWRAIGGPGRFDISKPAGPGTTGAADPGISGDLRGRRDQRGRTGRRQPDLPLLLAGHAARHQRLRRDRIHRHAEDHPHPGRPHPRQSPHLHRRAHLAQGDRADALGYSIGKWVDTDGDGRYDVLEVETRGFRGPRAFDASGLPLHRDNQTVVKERILHRQGRSERRP